jgi:diguanylate cyclase (GGDEF)-like protein
VTLDLAQQAVALLVYGLVSAYFGARYREKRVPAEPTRASAPSLPSRATAQAHNEELFERCRAAEENARVLQRTLLHIPEIAQRLLAARTLRDVPEVALDLIEELFCPTYAVFYRVQRGEFVAAARRGESEFELGHRLKKGQGVVGWTALRQLPFTPEDAGHETRSVRERDLALAMPRDGFAVCLPVVTEEKTLAVILVGPSPRAIEKPIESGRVVALLAAAAIMNVEIVQRQRHLAETDGLTGLLNKRTILEYLGGRLLEPRHRPLSVFLFDIDYFKTFNDTNGHLAGDELLKRLGALIRDHSRDGEALGRYGGEEFMLVMEAPKSHAIACAERLRKLVATTDFPHRQSQPGGHVTVSGGVATCPADGTDMAALLSAADRALYEAKRAGRNRIVAYTAPDLAAIDDEWLDGEREKPQ